MTYARPKTKESELLAQLELLFEDDETPNDFVLAGLAREAKKLMQADAAAGHIVLAGMAALRWDFNEVENHCQQALKFERSTAVLLNAAINFRNVGLVHQAADLAFEAAMSDPLNLKAQKDAIDSLYAVGRIQDCLSTLQINLNRGIPLEESGGDGPANTLSALEALGLSERQLYMELDLTYGTLREMRYRPRGFTVSIEMSSDGEQSVSYGVTIYGDHSDEIEVESILADRLAELSEWNPSRLSVKIQSEEQNEHNAL